MEHLPIPILPSIIRRQAAPWLLRVQFRSALVWRWVLRGAAAGDGVAAGAATTSTSTSITISTATPTSTISAATEWAIPMSETAPAATNGNTTQHIAVARHTAIAAPRTASEAPRAATL